MIEHPLNHMKVTNKKKMSLFSSKHLITSDKDLTYYLKKHKNISKLTHNATFIIPYDHLKNISITHIAKKKVGIIINTQHSESNNPSGHWALLVINRLKQCLFIDSLASTFQNNKNIQNELISFCKKHKLKLLIWDVKTQNTYSQSCGFQILFYLDFFSKHNIAKFVNLKRLLKQYSLLQAEHYILKKAYALCSR